MIQQLARRWRTQSKLPAFSTPEVARLMQRSPATLSDEERRQLADQLMALYSPDAESAQEVRRALLAVIQSGPHTLQSDETVRFIAEHIEPDDLQALTWDHSNELLNFYSALYAFNSDQGEYAEQLRGHARRLIHDTLLEYERTGRYEELIKVLRLVPAPPSLDEAELAHLRHVAQLYESRRVLRNRRWLYLYLLAQVILVLFVFPLLFQNAENGAIQRQIEQASGVELGDEGYRLFSYPTALYWTIITATSIGYGDITPLTTTGRLIAAVLGTLGVITIGVIGGLILRWISPRNLS